MQNVQQLISLLEKRIEDLGAIAMQSSSSVERREAESEIRALRTTIRNYKRAIEAEKSL